MAQDCRSRRWQDDPQTHTQTTDQATRAANVFPSLSFSSSLHQNQNNNISLPFSLVCWSARLHERQQRIASILSSDFLFLSFFRRRLFNRIYSLSSLDSFFSDFFFISIPSSLATRGRVFKEEGGCQGECECDTRGTREREQEQQLLPPSVSIGEMRRRLALLPSGRSEG